MIADSEGKTPLQLMFDLDHKALSDTMVDYEQFEDLIDYQEDVATIMKQTAPNLINFIDSSLQVTKSSAEIDRIEMPISTQLITFRSNIATLQQESI